MVISLDSLPDLLETIGIDDDDVSIGENADNRWCVAQRRWTPSSGLWKLSKSDS